MSEPVMRITKPGIYTLPAPLYHSDPVPGGSLSFTGATKLLSPSCPAKFKHWRDNPSPPNGDFDIGHAVHDLVLRGEDTVVVIDYDGWRTKESRTQRDNAYAAGKTPLLVANWAAVQDMAEALWTNPIASALLRGGKPEQAIFWKDTVTGVQRRALLDFLPDRDPTSMYGVDYKSCQSAHPDAASKSMWSYKYVQQAPWYLDAIDAMELSSAEYTPFFFIFQEKKPPYVVTVAQLDIDAIRWGRKLNRKAMDIYRRCVAMDRWPGYADDVVNVPLPSYAEYELLGAADRGEFDLMSEV